MRIVVALDSFKGSLSAPDACVAVSRGVREVLPGSDIEMRPMADGGEGTAEALHAALKGIRVTCTVRGPLPQQDVHAGYVRLPGDGGAVVEMASASGLTLVPAAERNPLRATTYGTGQLILHAAENGAHLVRLAVGGSATVDGGMGAARAFGWRFLDAHGCDLPSGGGALSSLVQIEAPEARSWPDVEVLCDVTNPLVGARGAARIFGPQKGASPGEVELLESGLARLADCVKESLGVEIATLAGGGAAGGLAAGAVAFLGGRLVSGIDSVIEAVDLDKALEGADWVLTGEGSFDDQSLHGKVVSGVLRAGQRQGARVGVLAGRVTLEESAWRTAGIDAVASAAPEGMAEETAIHQAAALLQEAATRFARTWLSPS